jgi:nucleotide-binding universal stress UspA family protein
LSPPWRHKGGCSADKELKDGYPVKVILDEIDEQKIDLVVIGSQGMDL